MAASACGDSKCARCAADGRVADVATDGVRGAMADVVQPGFAHVGVNSA